MAKKRGRGRKKQPQRRHLRSVPTTSECESGGVEDQALFQGLRAALRGDHPAVLLEAVSGLLTATDPRQANPMTGEGPPIEQDTLLASFVDIDYAETTAALTVIQAFTADEAVAARIGAILSTRRQPMPGWLTVLADVEIRRVMQMTHILGDGDDYFLAAQFPTGEELTALVYVDHNMGTLVKDAFVIPDRVERVLQAVEETQDDPDQTWDDFDPADARAIIEDAIAQGARTLPQPESESWPLCRPLVEWLVGKLPAGGSVPERPEWSDAQIDALHDDFFASPYGRDLDHEDERALLDNITWFGTGYGPGDPLRWSPVNVEVLLADWMPRKIVADTAYLAKAPGLLRGFIRFCHDRKGIRADLTTETLDAVDQWEPEFQRVIRSSRPQGPAALLAGLLDEEYDDPGQEFMAAYLGATVGGLEVLRNLDDEPLPDEPFEWAGIPEDVRERVTEVLELCDRCADELFDVEHRTAFRRLLSRATVGDPSIFRRKGRADRAAAAICWTIAKANYTVAAPGKIESQQLSAWFGLKDSASQRSEAFQKAIGVNPHRQFGDMRLGTPDFLIGARRAQIIDQRDRRLADA